MIRTDTILSILSRSYKRAIYGAIALIGYILSPASWWNDLIVNIPLALLITKLLAPLNIDPRIAFTASYWATNVLGVILLVVGSRGVFSAEVKGKGLITSIIASTIYTILVLYVLSL